MIKLIRSEVFNIIQIGENNDTNDLQFFISQNAICGDGNIQHFGLYVSFIRNI